MFGAQAARRASFSSGTRRDADHGYQFQSPIKPVKPVKKTKSGSSLQLISSPSSSDRLKTASKVKGNRASCASSCVVVSDSEVSVVIRVRPPISEDYRYYVHAEDFEISAKVQADERTLLLSRKHTDDRMFYFDQLLGPQCTQHDMYIHIAYDIVEDVLKGFNGTIMAYGQTGSGKTHTIFGSNKKGRATANINNNNLYSIHNADPEAYGVIPKAVHHIFSFIERNAETCEFVVSVAFVQLYLDNVLDLLNVDQPSSKKSVREDTHSGGVYVDELAWVTVDSAMQLLEVVAYGATNRYCSQNMMNQDSSRSHVILFISVEQRPITNTIVQQTKKGMLTIVDLAGSERLNKTFSDGMQLEEVKHINKSLSALANCVRALAKQSSSSTPQHIPFRDSKLTKLLNHSLSGNTKTCICCNISPASIHYDESLSTLSFASQCKSVSTYAMVNESKELKQPALLARIQELEQMNYDLLSQNAYLEEKVAQLQHQIEQQQQEQQQQHQIITENLVSTDELQYLYEEKQRQLIAHFSSIIEVLQLELDRFRKQDLASLLPALDEGLRQVHNYERHINSNDKDNSAPSTAQDHNSNGIITNNNSSNNNYNTNSNNNDENSDSNSGISNCRSNGNNNNNNGVHTSNHNVDNDGTKERKKKKGPSKRLQMLVEGLLTFPSIKTILYQKIQNETLQPQQQQLPPPPLHPQPPQSQQQQPQLPQQQQQQQQQRQQQQQHQQVYSQVTGSPQLVTRKLKSHSQPPTPVVKLPVPSLPTPTSNSLSSSLSSSLQSSFAQVYIQQNQTSGHT